MVEARAGGGVRGDKRRYRRRRRDGWFGGGAFARLDDCRVISCAWRVNRCSPSRALAILLHCAVVARAAQCRPPPTSPGSSPRSSTPTERGARRAPVGGAPISRHARVLGSDHMPAPPGAADGIMAAAAAASGRAARRTRSRSCSCSGLQRLRARAAPAGAAAAAPRRADALAAARGGGARRGAVAARARRRRAAAPAGAGARARPRAEPQPAPARRGVRRAAAGAAGGRGARQRRRRRGGRGGAGARGALRDAEHRRRPPQVGRRARRLRPPADAARGAGDAAARRRRAELGWMCAARARAARLPTRRSRPCSEPFPTRAGIGSSTRTCTLGGGCGGGPRAAGAIATASRPSSGEWFQLIAVLEAQRQSELTLVQLARDGVRADAEAHRNGPARQGLRPPARAARCASRWRVPTSVTATPRSRSVRQVRAAPCRRAAAASPSASPRIPAREHESHAPALSRSGAWFNERATRD